MANNKGSNGGFEVPANNVTGVSGVKANETQNYMSNIEVEDRKYDLSNKTRFNGSGKLILKVLIVFGGLYGLGWIVFTIVAK